MDGIKYGELRFTMEGLNEVVKAKSRVARGVSTIHLGPGG